MRKKLLTLGMALAMSFMTITAYAAEPVATGAGPYEFAGGADTQEGEAIANPFKGKNLDAVTVEYTCTIAETPTYLTGYDTVLTFGEKTGAFIYICNELVGFNANDGVADNYYDFWPSGQAAVMAYPGAGETYTVQVVFDSKGVHTYLNGDPVNTGKNTGGSAEITSIMEVFNTVDTIHIGSNGTSYWAPQDMTLKDVKFYEGDASAGTQVSETRPETTKGVAMINNNAEGLLATEEEEDESSNLLPIIVIACVAVVVIAGVVVVITKKKKR